MSNPAPELYSDEQWAALLKEDPSLKIFESVADAIANGPSAAAPWQGAGMGQVFTEDPFQEKQTKSSDVKSSHPYWRKLQESCWTKYRNFGPINASINSKADYVAGRGFDIYSDDIGIAAYLKDLVYSYRNQLYTRARGWVVRMLGEGELFLLITLDEEGKATIRSLEPGRIGSGDDTGLILNPEDSAQTLFYKYKGSAGEEFIPDVNIGFNPDLYKLVRKEVSPDKTKRSRGAKKFSQLGGFRRFILHWKNLTGILEYERDISSLSTVLEPVNLYLNAIKWQLDHKKALASYTNIFSFEETAAGKIAWHLWQKMTPEQKKATGLTEPLTPGSRLFLMPGITYEVKAPQMQSLSGENQDLLNMAGAGARTPQDLWQGQSAGSTYASLKQSRSPLELEIENLQHKLELFVKYELLRFCFYAAQVAGAFPTAFKREVVTTIEGGNPTFAMEDVEPCELVNFTFPRVSFDDKIHEKINGYLGSKHAGLSGIGISDEKIAKDMGIGDLSRQKREQALERKKYGEPKLPVA